MKTVILIRHAKSSWNEPGRTDFERSLNHQGLRDAPLMGARLAARLHADHLKLDAFLCSSARRAVQTAMLLTNELGFPAHDISWRDELYLASPATMLHAICSMPDNIATVALLAHNPGITELAEILSGQYFGNIPTCGMVKLGFSVTRWADAAHPAKCIDFDYPKRQQ